jgi:enoyl-CoA hydratase
VSELVATDFENGVLHVTLLRPEKRNALSNALIAAIGTTFATWSERDDVSVAVLTGTGDKAFASGGDLKELESLREEADAVAFAARARAALDTIRRFPVPVVAVLNGDAFGGGAELAMACDLRVAMAHARIGFLQAKLNIATAWGGGTDMFNIVGPSRALRLLATAEVLGAADALRLGLIDAVAPEGEAASDFIKTYVMQMVQPSQVMRAVKSLAIMHRFGGPAEERARREGACFAKAWVHDDHWAAVAKMAGSRK